MIDIFSKFNGKKTYATAAIAICGSIIAYFGGEISLFETIIAVSNAIFAATIRHGVKTEATAAAASVTAK